MRATTISTLGLLLAVWIFGADRKTNPPPPYDLTTEFKAIVTIVDVREVPKDELFDGIHFSVQSKNDTYDVYVAPTAFVKIFGVEFKKGDEIELTASKVRFRGEDFALAREIRLGHVTLELRDDTGWPNWDWHKPTIPTGR